MNRAYLIYIILIVMHLNAAASGMLRQEINADEYSYAVFIPLEEQGVLALQYYKDQRKHDGWKLTMYDVQLMEQWSKDMDVESEYIPREYIFNKDTVVNLFFTHKRGKGSFVNLEIKLKDGSFIKNGFNGGKRIRLGNFDVLGENLFSASLVKPNGLMYSVQALYTVTLIPIIFNHKLYSIKPQVFVYNTRTQTHKVVKPEIEGTCEILATKVDKVNKKYLMLVKQFKNRKSNLYWLEYNEEGEELVKRKLEDLNAQNILSADITFTSTNETLLIGTFNYAKESRRDAVASYTDGVFISKIVDSKEAFIKFHPYTNLSNAYKYLEQHQMIRFKEKTRKGKATNLGFDLYMHPNVISTDSQYIMVGEVYYPEYHLESHYDVRGYWMYEEVFDGYNYTHGIAISFDEKGNLKWDNIMKLEDVFSYTLRENVILHTEIGQQVMLYYMDGKIYSKGFSGNEVSFKERNDELLTVKENEAVVVEENGLIYKWYDSYFLISGYQEVESLKGKRKVFFISKVAFQ